MSVCVLLYFQYQEKQLGADHLDALGTLQLVFNMIMIFLLVLLLVPKTSLTHVQKSDLEFQMSLFVL